MLISEYEEHIINGVQEECFTDVEYLQLTSKAIGLLMKNKYNSVIISHKGTPLMYFVRVKNEPIISYRMTKEIYAECSFTTILNAYISIAIVRANKQLKKFKEYEKDFTSADGDIDTTIIAFGADIQRK